MSKDNLIIFTDLDGTLLEHNNYSFNEASFMLDVIKKRDIPLIIVTSKTKDEVIHIQKLLGIKNPFIIENGAGIIVPKGDGYENIALGESYEKIRTAFVKYSKNIQMHGFFDMSVEEIMKHTNLSKEQAVEAKERTFTEPFILHEEEKLEELIRLAEIDGLSVVKGGRFYHLITKGQDKAAAIQRVVQRYEKEQKNSFKTIALGDGENDLSMLRSVDIPILIPKHNGEYISCDIQNIKKAPYPGPLGWNEALKESLNVR